mgnify:CR=1 FL=1
MLEVNDLRALASADHSVFGRKMSWVKLATACLERIAVDTLLYRAMGETRERAGLLYDRLERRRAMKLRTPAATQHDIETVHRLHRGIVEVSALRRGAAVDVEGILGRLHSLRVAWDRVGQLVPHVIPKTEHFLTTVRTALERVVTHPSTRPGLVIMAQRLQQQWAGVSRDSPRGEVVQWDDD